MNKIVLFLLMSVSLYAQTVTNHITIRGERYEFIDDMNLDYRTQPLRPVRYARLNHSDLDTYLTTFIRDAIYNEQDLNLGVSESIVENGVSLPINTMTFVDHQSFYGGRNIGGSSWRSWYPGFIITINENIWWGYSNSRQKLKLMYHELSHALLMKDHICDVTQAWTTQDGGNSHQNNGDILGIMATGACDTRYGGSGYNQIGLWCAPTTSICTTSGEYDFTQWDDLLRHLYATHNPLRVPGGSISGKGGPDVIHD